MKIAVIIVRSLLGLGFTFFSLAFFFQLMPQPEQTGAIKTFFDGMVASIYLLPTAKAVELICGLAFLAGRFVPLATILLAPILVNIFCIHLFLDPKGLPIAIVLGLMNLFLAYAHRDAFKPLFRSKGI
jgi:uncharacterized membrane protein YphA (DoxX/SURF4 family)